MKESREKVSNYDEFAQFYDRIVEGFRYNDLAEYCDDTIRKNGVNGGILLDLACGTGTVSQMMAEFGWDVIGVDISPEMLSNAKQHEKITYICQDMTMLDLYGTVDAAICTFDALNHLLSDEDLSSAFERVSLFMNPGGVFVFDMNTVYCHKTIFAGNIFVSDTFKEKDNVYCVRNHVYAGGGTTVMTLNIFSEGADGKYTRRRECNVERAYRLDRVRELCEQAGLDVIGCYDFLTENPASEMSERVVFVCKKTVENPA